MALRLKLEFSQFIRLTQFAVEAGLLRKQIEEISGVFPELTPEILNSAIDLLNELAQTEIARQAIERAA